MIKHDNFLCTSKFNVDKWLLVKFARVAKLKCMAVAAFNIIQENNSRSKPAAVDSIKSAASFVKDNCKEKAPNGDDVV